MLAKASSMGQTYIPRKDRITSGPDRSSHSPTPSLTRFQL